MVLISACGEVPRVWNEGGVPKITVSSVNEVHAEGIRRGAPCKAGYYVAAWCEDDEIRLPDHGTRKMLVAYAYHELGERIGRDFPEIWRYLNAMATPTFPCGEDDHRAGTPFDKAAVKALKEYHDKEMSNRR